MNACQQQDLLLDYVYEELSPAQAAALTEHLQGCAQCSRELMGMKGVRGAMAALPPRPLSQRRKPGQIRALCAHAPSWPPPAP